ncbi:HAD family hydrolase [Shewanella corallii]|uniref:HAD family hydrolase n=1 Tax=Shewanella corallii TaxID=560080 RepID=A0ABT0N813_9GAMM|nr:HAD family hydrolase [Shewanella corallii]MCL2914522.1 HAD family hydrolase [Shewanella corallii]
MSTVYLFDWGDTLMVDFPGQSGKMCDWTEVQAVSGAVEVLECLSRSNTVYVATNAADSSEADIQSAFERAGLSRYISGYFCKSNLGIGKGSPEFFEKIVNLLDVSPQAVVMVGDTYDKDIEPAVTAGITAIWFNPKKSDFQASPGVRQIQHLSELCL